jgi:hypothetical protein
MAAILGGLRRVVFHRNAFLCSTELKSTQSSATKWLRIPGDQAIQPGNLEVAYERSHR